MAKFYRGQRSNRTLVCHRACFKVKSIILWSSIIITQDVLLDDSIELKANKHCV